MYGRIGLRSNELEKELEIKEGQDGEGVMNNLRAIEPLWMEKRPTPNQLLLSQDRCWVSSDKSCCLQ